MIDDEEVWPPLERHDGTLLLLFLGMPNNHSGWEKDWFAFHVCTRAGLIFPGWLLTIVVEYHKSFPSTNVHRKEHFCES